MTEASVCHAESDDNMCDSADDSDDSDDSADDDEVSYAEFPTTPHMPKQLKRLWTNNVINAFYKHLERVFGPGVNPVTVQCTVGWKRAHQNMCAELQLEQLRSYADLHWQLGLNADWYVFEVYCYDVTRLVKNVIAI